MIKDHVLLPKASRLEEAKTEIIQHIDANKIKEIVEMIPDDFLEEESMSISPIERRLVYIRFLTNKLSNITLLTKEAKDARNGNI